MKYLRKTLNLLIKLNPILLLNIFYHNDIGRLRKSCKENYRWYKEVLYYAYLERFGSWIGLGATFESIPIFPHGLHGIFISHKAHIGKDVVIFHQVTIGSNMTVGSKRNGSPIIGDNVYIGCGAKIIGALKIGNNVRIGANCIIVKDVPENHVCVMRGMEAIKKEEKMDNTWVRVTAPDQKQ